MISLINVETRLASIAERLRANANGPELEGECSLLQKNLQRAAEAMYPNYKEGRIETRIGTRPAYVQDHEHFAEIETYLADAIRDLHIGDVDAALAAVEYARSICATHSKPDSTETPEFAEGSPPHD